MEMNYYLKLKSKRPSYWNGNDWSERFADTYFYETLKEVKTIRSDFFKKAKIASSQQKRYKICKLVPL